MRLIFILAALAATFVAEPGLARSTEQRSQSVRYADLDLGTETGRAELDRRLREAVKNVCGSASDADLAGKNDVRRCRAATADLASLRRRLAIAAASQSSPALAAAE